jgi:hypothetical protein
VTAVDPEGANPMPDPADPPPASSSSAATRRLLFLVIVGLLALLFVAAFGRDIGKLDPGLGDPQRMYGAPQPSLETAS